MTHDRQGPLFVRSESDRYFERNQSAYAQIDPDRDLPLRVLDLYGLTPRSVLDVGAANGVRLAALCRRTGARGVALEPSWNALMDGKARFPNISFTRGVADRLPFADGSFDLVAISYVLHWIDRGRLLAAATELDRVLQDRGVLLLVDFHPSNLTRVPYHHVASGEVYTFKQNYGALFVATGLYHEIAHLTTASESGALVQDAAEWNRCGVWLLRKDLGSQYVDGTVPGPARPGAPHP